MDDANNRELGRSGACAAVVKALNSFGNINQKVAENGCNAVGNLAFDEGNRQEFGRVGGCAAVINALNAFGSVNVDIADEGCNAVLNLAFNDANKRTLLALNARSVVESCIKNPFKDKALRKLSC